jgi:hypothetical protein
MSLDFNVKTRIRLCWMSLAAVVLTALGCGGSETSVVGQVMRSDGSPLAGATVTVRSDETGKWASGLTDESGRYKLTTPGDGEPLPSGTYYITIAENRNSGFDADQQPVRTIPQKYELPNASGLQVVIEADVQTVFDVKLDPIQQ